MKQVTIHPLRTVGFDHNPFLTMYGISLITRCYYASISQGSLMFKQIIYQKASPKIYDFSRYEFSTEFFSDFRKLSEDFRDFERILDN